MPSYVSGLDELNKNCALLPERMQKNVFRAAVRGGASEYIKASRENLGPQYVQLKKSLKIKNLRSRGGIIRLRVHPERGTGARYDGWFAHIVEYGSYLHPGGWEIKPWKSKSGTGKKALSFDGIALGKVWHPGIKPTRFMTRAMNKETRIINGMLNRGKKAFNRQIANQWLRSNR